MAKENKTNNTDVGWFAQLKNLCWSLLAPREWVE